MNVNKINLINALNFNAEIQNTDKIQNNNLQISNSNEVASTNANNAIVAKNSLPKQTVGTFIQSINLPYLNVKGNLYQLPNGQKCFIAKKEGPCVIKTFFKVGSINEPDNLRGISHFIEHNLFNGSKNLKSNEFVENVNRMGGRYNASTGYKGTDYFIQSPLHNDSDLEKFIKMHADMLSNPTFSNDMLAKEKGPVISEIQMYEDSPQNLAMNTVLRNLFNIKSTSNELIGGSVQNIQNLTRDDVLKYYKQNYNPKTALTVVVGDVDEKKTLKMLADNFANFKTPDDFKQYFEKLTPIEKSVRKDLYSSNAQSTTIQIGFAGPDNPKDLETLNVLLTALCGYDNAKLSKAMRDKNLSINYCYEKLGNKEKSPSIINFDTTTSDNNEQEILELIYKKIHEMAYTPLSDSDLQVAKNKIRNRKNYAAESNMSVVSHIGNNFTEGNGIDNLVDFEKNLNAVTAQDVMDAAKKFLNLNKASICVVHPKAKQNITFGRKTIPDFDVKTYKTQNNATITTLNSPNSKIYSISFNLKHQTSPKNIAIPIILTKMLSKGTGLMSEDAFLDMKDRNNINSSISVNHKGGSIDIDCPKESLNVALDVLNKNLYYPALTLENFEKAKKEIRNIYLSNPKSANDRADEEIYKNSPACSSLRKVCEEMEKISLNDVIEYYNNMMISPECKMTLSGNLSDKNIINNVFYAISHNGRFYNPKEVTNKTNIQELTHTTVVTDTQDRKQADIVQVFSFHETGNILDRAALMLMNEILGGNSNSRLFQDLREKQKLAYHVSSSYGPGNQEAKGALLLKIGTTTENDNNPQQSQNLQKALDGFKKHLDKLTSEDVSQEELEAAKLQIKSKLAFALESTDGKNAMLASSMNTLYKTQYIKQLLAAIDNTTAKDIKTIANFYLKKPSVISIVASNKTIENNKDYLKTLGEVKNF